MSKRVDKLIADMDPSQLEHYYWPPAWFANTANTLEDIAYIYAQTGSKPRRYESIPFHLPVSYLLRFPRQPKGPVAQNYGLDLGNYGKGKEWLKLVKEVKSRKGWTGSPGALILEIDRRGTIRISDGNHRFSAIVEAFGPSSKIKLPVEISFTSSRFPRNLTQVGYYIVPASAKPGQFRIRKKSRRPNVKNLAVQAAKKERKRKNEIERASDQDVERILKALGIYR